VPEKNVLSVFFISPIDIDAFIAPHSGGFDIKGADRPWITAMEGQ
jgi:hypothetical protein